MSRRLRPCLTCKPNNDKTNPFTPLRGYTRHDDQVCAACRQEARRDGLVDLTSFLDVEDGLRLLAGPVDSELRRPEHYAGRGGW